MLHINLMSSRENHFLNKKNKRDQVKMMKKGAITEGFSYDSRKDSKPLWKAVAQHRGFLQ